MNKHFVYIVPVLWPVIVFKFMEISVSTVVKETVNAHCEGIGPVIWPVIFFKFTEKSESHSKRNGKHNFRIHHSSYIASYFFSSLWNDLSRL